MAKTTTYTCDRCGQTAIDKPKFLSEVCIQMTSKYDPKEWTSVRLHSACWCDECLLQTGLSWPAKDQVVPATPPTLEEIVREIIRDEVEAATGARS